MGTFVFRLQAPHPTFALDMTDEERGVMERHTAHWQPLIDSGQIVVFGPVLDGTGSWGLGVVDSILHDDLAVIGRARSAVKSRLSSESMCSDTR